MQSSSFTFTWKHFSARGALCLSTSCFTSWCSGSTRGPALVMRGQRNRHPGFRQGAGGQGPSSGGQRIHGPETHTKKGINFKFHWQKSLWVPSRLIKLACDLESLLSTGTLPGEGGGGRGVGGYRRLHIFIRSRKFQHLLLLVHIPRQRLTKYIGFLYKKWSKMRENQLLCIYIKLKNDKQSCLCLHM